VIPRTKARPTGKVPRVREYAHVESCLAEDRPRGDSVDTGDCGQPRDQFLVFGYALLNLRCYVADVLFQTLHLYQHRGQQLSLMVRKRALQREFQLAFLPA
jgi:hypothetical protein